MLEDDMWNLKDKTLLHAASHRTALTLSYRSTCGLRTTALLPRTWRVADQAPNVHVLSPMPVLIKDKPRTYTFFPQCRYWSKPSPERKRSFPNAGTDQRQALNYKVYRTVGGRGTAEHVCCQRQMETDKTKQPWKLIYWCIYSSFSNTACYPARRCYSNCSRLVFRKCPVRIPTRYR
jgi:hypothetical protein